MVAVTHIAPFDHSTYLPQIRQYIHQMYVSREKRDQRGLHCGGLVKGRRMTLEAHSPKGSFGPGEAEGALWPHCACSVIRRPSHAICLPACLPIQPAYVGWMDHSLTHMLVDALHSFIIFFSRTDRRTKAAPLDGRLGGPSHPTQSLPAISCACVQRKTRQAPDIHTHTYIRFHLCLARSTKARLSLRSAHLITH